MTDERKEEFVEFPLDEFLKSKALWATNYFVLWPLGLTLTLDVGDEDDGSADRLSVREWVFPKGELAETINTTDVENTAAFGAFLSFVQRRLMAMKPDERRAALKSLEAHSVLTSLHVLLAE